MGGPRRSIRRCRRGAATVMPQRLALPLLLAGRTGAQPGCASQEDLLAHLRWVREACDEEGEALADAEIERGPRHGFVALYWDCVYYWYYYN